MLPEWPELLRQKVSRQADATLAEANAFEGASKANGVGSRCIWRLSRLGTFDPLSEVRYISQAERLKKKKRSEAPSAAFRRVHIETSFGELRPCAGPLVDRLGQAMVELPCSDDITSSTKVGISSP